MMDMIAPIRCAGFGGKKGHYTDWSAACGKDLEVPHGLAASSSALDLSKHANQGN